MAPTVSLLTEALRTVNGAFCGLCVLAFVVLPKSNDAYISAEASDVVNYVLWALLYPFTESSLPSLVLILAGLLLYGVPTEKVMGHVATAQFLCVVCVVVTPALLALWSTFLSGSRFRGPWPVLEAMLVAQCYTRGLGTVVWPLTQQGTEASTTPAAPPPSWRRALAKVQIRHLPLLTLAAALVLDVVGWEDGRGWNWLMCLCSAVVGWVYLDFSWRGVDSVTTFPLTALWVLPPLPRSVEAFVNRLAGRPMFGRGGGGGGSSGIAPVLFTGSRVGGQVLLPGSTPEEAERRRAIALAALSRRLQEQQQHQQQQQQERQQPPSSSPPPAQVEAESSGANHAGSPP